MNLDEIKALKSETENRIREQIMNFCNQTGLIVKSADFEVMAIHEIGGLRKTAITSVEITVEI